MEVTTAAVVAASKLVEVVSCRLLLLCEVEELSNVDGVYDKVLAGATLDESASETAEDFDIV